MIHLILVRHGNTFEEGQIPLQVGAKTDLPLTEKGRHQAEQMALYLKRQNRSPAAIFAGPLKRQTESAQIIANAFSLPFHCESALTEIDYGLWEGLSADELSKRWPQEYAAWNESAKWPENLFGSSSNEHKMKLEQWLQRLRASSPMNGPIIAVTSNGLLRFFKNEKVKTGHFCEIILSLEDYQITSWNRNP